MKSFFNKIAIIVLTAMTMSVTANAQEKGDKAAGVNLAFSGQNIVGIGAKYQYNITKPLRVESSFFYTFNRDLINLNNKWNLYVNAHLLIPIANRIKLYPIAGLGIVRRIEYLISEEYEKSYYNDTWWGFNFGGGIDYKITDKLIINVELHNKWLDNQNRTYLSTGIIYRF